jgi:hypothetical protein
MATAATAKQVKVKQTKPEAVEDSLEGVYHGAAKRQLSPAPLKPLKGKTCFHVKTLDDGLRKDIEAALEMSTKVYRERGWL